MRGCLAPFNRQIWEFCAHKTGRGRFKSVKFADRIEAGISLRRALRSHFKGGDGEDDLLVLGIPTGVIPVGVEVASALGAPFDVWLAQKISVPENKEFAIGSVANRGEIIIDQPLVK